MAKVNLIILKHGTNNHKIKKTIKNNAFQYEALMLYLVPYMTPCGYITCKKSTPECRKFCLGQHSGFAFSTPHKVARWRDTMLKIKAPEVFWEIVRMDAQRMNEECIKKGKKLVIRTSALGEDYGEDCPHGRKFYQYCHDNDILIYNYTADLSRIKKQKKLFPNNFFCFSFKQIIGIERKWSKETKANGRQAFKAIEAGYDLAVIFANIAKEERLPDTFSWNDKFSVKVFDADDNDFIFLLNTTKPRTPCVFGLRLKGAKDVK